MNGQTCASGLGNASSSMAENQPSPSIDGSSAKFNLGGRTPYSNALWWRSVGANDNVTHFNYDVSFYTDRPDLPEALEFDVNEAIGGVRYIWGSECDFKNSGKWDVWNPAAGKWQHTPLSCRQFSANTWHHLTWELERVNHQVHYIALTVDGQRMNVDILMDPQSHYSGDDISVAFQLDGDFRQDPYNVWLDQVTLTMW